MSKKKLIPILLGLTVAALTAWELPLMPRSFKTTLIKIPEEQKTAREIAQTLASEGILRHPRAFLLFIQTFGWDKKIQRGTYLLHLGEGWPTLTKKLLTGDSFTIKVSLPEGWTVEQMAQRLEAFYIIPSAKALVELAKANSLEGFLYPSTYFFEPDTPVEDIVEIMTGQFEHVWQEYFEALRLPLKFTKKDVVTLASIIERETTIAEEKPLIAGVFLNRLRKGWKLEADPTVQYALGTWKERLTYKDIKIKSPYNTYQRWGLPPGPIGNPGASSIAAVFNPVPTEFMYFVARGDSSHVFFQSLTEHNRYRYLQRKARQAKVTSNQKTKP